MDAADSIAEAIAIRDGRIIAVGQDEAVSRLAGPRTRVIELAGKTVTPGLIDTHAHLLSSGMDETLKVDLTRAGSLNELMPLVKARVDTMPAGQWVEGFGWNEGIRAEHRGPTLAELDAISGDHPVLLENVTHHYSIVNSAAMRLAHIDAVTPDPAGGKIERAPDGKPTGMLRERPAIDMVAKQIPPFTPEQYSRVLARMIDQLHAEGMTGVKDIVNPREWAAYVTSAQAAKLSVHACPLFWAGSTVESAKATLDAITQARQQITPLADGDLKVCGAKILLDGSAAGRMEKGGLSRRCPSSSADRQRLSHRGP